MKRSINGTESYLIVKQPILIYAPEIWRSWSLEFSLCIERIMRGTQSQMKEFACWLRRSRLNCIFVDDIVGLSLVHGILLQKGLHAMGCIKFWF